MYKIILCIPKTDFQNIKMITKGEKRAKWNYPWKRRKI